MPDGKVRPSKDYIVRHQTSVQNKSAKSKNIIDLTRSLTIYNEAWKAYYSATDLSQQLKNAADKRVEDTLDKWLLPRIEGSSVRGTVKKLLKEYRPASDSEIAEKCMDRLKVITLPEINDHSTARK